MVDQNQTTKSYYASRWTDSDYRVYEKVGESETWIERFNTWDAAHLYASLANMIEKKFNEPVRNRQHD